MDKAVGQSISRSVMLDATRRGIQPVNAASRPDVDALPLIFRDTPDIVAGQPFGSRVCDKARVIRIRVINTTQSSTAGSHPEPSPLIEMN